MATRKYFKSHLNTACMMTTVNVNDARQCKSGLLVEIQDK